MAKMLNLARAVTATTGTGTLTLGSAVSGFKSWADAGAQDGETYFYAIKDGTSAEIGTGVYTASGATLTRNVIASTNSDTAINLSGSSEVFSSPAASAFYDVDALVEETVAALDDTVPAYDTSASGHRKFQWSNIFKLFNAFTEKTTPLVTDFIAGYSTADSASRKISLANMFKAITGLTAETAPATDDELALYDTSASAADKITLADLLKVVNSLTADALPDTSSDYLLSYDTSASAAKKVLMDDLLGAGSGGGSVALQVFNASGTYTPTVGMKFALVIATGGGAAGRGSLDNSAHTGPGGPGGGTAINLFDADTIGGSQSVTIGSGGSSSSAGGNTTFGSLLTGNGGSAPSSSSGTTAVGSALGGTATGGAINLRGGPGRSGVTVDTMFCGGQGGASFWGDGGIGGSGTGAGSRDGRDGLAPGTGGGGGTGSTSANGGSGANGIVFILEFL